MLAFHRFMGSPTRSPSRQNRCNGWGAALISASGSLTNTGLSTWLNRGDAHMAWRRNQGMQEDAQEFASEEAQKQRDWEEAEWQRQWDINSEFNSPSALRARLEKAGLNPYMAMSDGMSGQVVSASGAPVGASASSGVGSAPLGRGSTVDVASGMADFAKAIESLSSARKNTAEYDSIRAKLDKQIEALELDNESKRYANAVSGDLATWVLAHQHAMPAMTYRELTARVANIAQNTAVAESQEALTNVQKEIAELQKIVAKYDSDLSERMTTQLDDIVKLKVQKLREEVRSEHNLGTMYTQQGTSAMMNARTNESVGSQNIEESKSRVNINASTREQINKTVDLLKEQITNAQKNNDWFTVTRVSELIRNLLGAGASAASAAAGFIK